MVHHTQKKSGHISFNGIKKKNNIESIRFSVIKVICYNWKGHCASLIAKLKYLDIFSKNLEY